MRKTISIAVAAFVLGGAATGAALSQAQPAPPAAQQMEGAPPHPGMPFMPHPGGMHPGMLHHMCAFALVYPQSDRQLAPADVQKIAEAFLLWHGNHTWKVTDVAATAAGPIGFSLATPEGGVIAKFTMDPHTARVTRVS